MKRRPYDNSRRQEMEAETIRRIVAATVNLHAEKGALATTHGEIAKAAGVSVATVYKHFPTRDALLPHCSAMVAAQAPQIDVQAILGARGRNEKLSRLVRALHQQYRHFHPWVRWSARDAAVLPALAEVASANRKRTEDMVRHVLDAVAGAPLSIESFALAMVVLDYSAWQRLDRMLDDPERAAVVAEQALQILMPRLAQQQVHRERK